MTRLLATLLIVGLPLVAGCQTYPTDPSAGIGDASPREPRNDPQIMVLEPELRPGFASSPRAS